MAQLTHLVKKYIDIIEVRKNEWLFNLEHVAAENAGSAG